MAEQSLWISGGLLVAGSAVLIAGVWGYQAREQRRRDAEAAAASAEPAARTVEPVPTLPPGRPAGVLTITKPTAAATTGDAQALATFQSNTIDEAIRNAGFADSNKGAHPSALRFALWAAIKLDPIDAFADPATQPSFQKILRDTDKERGKRICQAVIVAGIHGEDFNGHRVYEGVFVDAEKNPYQFFAVNDVANIFAGSSTGFCGVVVGREQYEALDNTTKVAVRVVGVFLTPKVVAQAEAGAKAR